MSGRIRTIKPELLEDAITAGLSHVAFRLFIGCILLADDYGNLRFELPWLRGQVFWAREVSLDEFVGAIEELTVAREGSTEPLISVYAVKGQRYGAIRGWAKHQRVQKPGKPRVPGPELAIPESGPLPSGDPPESLPPDLRSPIVEDDPDRGSVRAAARDTPQRVASLGGETPALAELTATLDTPIPDTWRARALAIVQRNGVDFDVPRTWSKYRADCIEGRRFLTEYGWVKYAERECGWAAERQARRDDTGWGKIRAAVLEPGDAPYCAAAKPPETPDYDREAAVTAAAALAAGAFMPVRKAAGT